MTLTKQMKKDGWIDLGSDYCWEDHSGIWGRQTSENGSEYVVVKFLNAEEYDIGYKYETSVVIIDLSDITPEDKQSVASFIGIEEPTDLELIWGYMEYWGAYHLNADQETSNTYPKRLRASAIRSANSCCGVS